MSKYFQIDIKLKDDIVIGDFAGQDELSNSFGYIPGSTLRGAVIYRLLNENIMNEKDILKRFIANDIYFLNFYKIGNNKRCIPTPLCFNVEKDKQRRRDIDTKLYNLFENTNSKEKNIEHKTLIKLNIGDFTIINNNRFEKISINKKAHLHIKTKNRVDKESKNKNSNTQMYRFEAIERDQYFRGFIKIDDDSLLDILQKVIKVGEKYYLGASRGNGYGRTEIIDLKIFDSIKDNDFNPEYNSFSSNMDFNNSFYLLCLSDVIFRNKEGKLTGEIDIELLNEKLGVNNCSLQGSSVVTKNISGYNSKLGGNLCQVVGIKAGSIYKYSYDGNLDINKVKAFTSNSIGERIHEGFGRIIIIPSLDLQYVDYKQESKNLQENRFKDVIINNVDEETLQNIAKQLYQNKFKEKSLSFYLNYKNLNKDINRKISHTQLAKWLNIISDLKTKKCEEGLKRYEDICKHIEDSTNDKKKIALKNFKETKIFMGNTNVSIDEFIRNSKDCNRESMYLMVHNILPKIVKVGRIKYQIDQKKIYYYNMLFLEEFLYYILRNKGGN